MTERPAREDFGFFHGLRVRYAEVDAQGIVFNGHYLTYFDVALTEYFRALGFDFAAELQASGCDFHVVHTETDYHAKVGFDDELEIGCRLERAGRSSLSFRLGVFGAGQTRLRASGRIVWVYTDQRSGQPTALPPALIERFDRPVSARPT